jgi:hypothetical protein
MPRAGLAEAGRNLLRAAVADDATVARFHALTVRVPSARCSVLWRGAVSGRGHGRFWLGQVAGRDVVVIAHRFAFALDHGVDALERVPVLGHRCDNPLCQVVGPGHVEPSTAWRNRHEWVMRRATVGGALRDSRGARGRAGDQGRAATGADPREPGSGSSSRAGRRPRSVAAVGVTVSVTGGSSQGQAALRG